MILEQKTNPRILPYAFVIKPETFKDEHISDLIPEVICWIYENLGFYNKDVWQIRTIMGSKNLFTVYFAKKEDAVAFKMAF